MRRLPLLSCAVVILAGCGGGDDPERGLQAATPTPSRTPAPTATPTATPSAPAPGSAPAPKGAVGRAQRVITGWSDTLRRSDVEGAARFFALPLVISQGQATRLTTRAEILAFNGSLPCGSKVTGVERQEGYFVASFVLTERPGKRCDGPGNTARVAFKLTGDRIREWRQLLEQAPEGDTA